MKNWKCLNANQFLEPLKIRFDLESWGYPKNSCIFVTEIDLVDLQKLQKKFGDEVSDKDAQKFAVEMLALCIVNESGNRICRTASQVEKLTKKNVKLLEALLEEANSINHFLDEDDEKKS